MSLPPPRVVVTAEDVEVGKPDPRCYLLGLERLGVTSSLAAAKREDVLVVEDSPTGIKAGKAAGCKVLGLATTHTIEIVMAAGADWIVRDLRSLEVLEEHNNRNIQVQLTDCWRPA